MPRNSVVQMIVFALVMSVATAVVHAGDREFDAVVGHIKKQYHGKQQGSFPLGLARLAVKFMHPAGVKSLRLAVFEEISGAPDNAGLDAVVRDNLDSTWQPVVRVYSRKAREQTYVYLRPHDDSVDVFVVAVDGEDATVVKAKVDVDSLAEFLSNSDWLASDEH